MIDPQTVLTDRLRDRYVLERELGHGGMAMVYLARDLRHDRMVALKVLRPELARFAGPERFLREIRIVANLSHPNILPLLDSDRIEDLLFYTMPYVNGEDLRARIDREGQLCIEDVLRITREIADALSYAHIRGIVHRDIKPGNILLQGKHALVTDFGVAYALTASWGEELTEPGLALGSRPYMSPEQAAGAAVDQRSDLYSLGVVVYEMLSGQRPSVMAAPENGWKSLKRVRPDCPPTVAAAVIKAIEALPDDRWQAAEDFANAISSTRPRRSRWKRPSKATLLVAVLLGLGSLLLTTLHQRSSMSRGPNPRYSMLVLPFRNLREGGEMDWLSLGAASMLDLNLSQWHELTVLGPEQVHDLMVRSHIKTNDIIGLESVQRIARDAGVGTALLGEFLVAGDSLHFVVRAFDVATSKRLDVTRVAGLVRADVRPLIDELALKLLKLWGAPAGIGVNLAAATTHSLEAFRAYLRGVERLNQWDLPAAQENLAHAISLDTTFGLSYYKLSVVRSWLTGNDDTDARSAIGRAMEYREQLPMRERTAIEAYASLLSNDQPRARQLYGQLVAHDSSDADAWYWIGESWFHDTTGANEALNWTKAIRAFRRALHLDPDYALAYDHVHFMLHSASHPRPVYALFPGDSFVAARSLDWKILVDWATLAKAVERARHAMITAAQQWVDRQPRNLRAHYALVDAYLSAKVFESAMREVRRFQKTSPPYPELPFMEARVWFEAGDVDRATAELRRALKTKSADEFGRHQGVPAVVTIIASSANALAYQGRIEDAVEMISLADRVRVRILPPTLADPSIRFDQGWKRRMLGELYAGFGVPANQLRRIWREALQEARSAPQDRRPRIVATGARAAIGLFDVLADSAPLAELRGMVGEPLPTGIRAVLKLRAGDSSAARKLLAETASELSHASYPYVHRYLEAQVLQLLGQDSMTIELLDGYDESLLGGRFDSGWAILGRIRLLRAASYERLGRFREAREEYARVLEQWRSADESLLPYIRQARQGFARVTEP